MSVCACGRDVCEGGIKPRQLETSILHVHEYKPLLQVPYSPPLSPCLELLGSLAAQREEMVRSTPSLYRHKLSNIQSSGICRLTSCMADITTCCTSCCIDIIAWM